MERQQVDQDDLAIYLYTKLSTRPTDRVGYSLELNSRGAWVSIVIVPAREISRLEP